MPSSVCMRALASVLACSSVAAAFQILPVGLRGAGSAGDVRAFARHSQGCLRSVPLAALRMTESCSEKGLDFTGVRFSLYPKGEHIKETVKAAMAGIPELGLELKADDVSTVLIGGEPALFEALRVAMGRCAADGNQVNLQATFSSGCPGETDLIDPLRKVQTEFLHACEHLFLQVGNELESLPLTHSLKSSLSPFFCNCAHARLHILLRWTLMQYLSDRTIQTDGSWMPF
jgi:hypothetical protein